MIVSDTLAVVAAVLIAMQVRFGGDLTTEGWSYALISVLLSAGWLIALLLNHAYDDRYLFSGNEEYQRVLRAALALTATIAFLSYVSEAEVARGYVTVAMPALTALGLAARRLNRMALHRAWSRRRCLRRVVVAGHAGSVAALTGQLRHERYHGLEVVAACVPRRDDLPPQLRTVPVIEGFESIATVALTAQADTVMILPCPELDGPAVRRLAWRLEGQDIDLVLSSALVEVTDGRTTIRPVDGLPMLHVEHPRLTGPGRLVKNLFDRTAAALALIVLAPLLAACALAVRLDRSAPGPVLFRQTRVGRHERPFTMLKFRTMRLGAEAQLAALRHLNDHDGVLFKLREDPRISRVGRFLRRYSLDELPQLVNVVRGEMSLVGPRPPLPAEVAAYPEDMRRRLVVKPGMTGLWQVSGRGDLPWEEAIRLDLRYVENWTLTLDLIILARTVTAVARSSGAY
ncbi:sugar transferase [Catenuloplanes indicus]|uniref:Exopolysaccharide biosynthesis polyprenyl glycosylphosphotransferase n=1 Tax=Catenuloplanes indicus TaxID=137267 RepID=A0AAE3W864_9ACTN|nr:sugar transferase [Catenuloplanes indicus]MDQ0371067.1 exopolysaccharide biosynthesis polyprenyl glycosylphosphotransferase [Catenuloplanes indicus]